MDYISCPIKPSRLSVESFQPSGEQRLTAEVASSSVPPLVSRDLAKAVVRLVRLSWLRTSPTETVTGRKWLAKTGVGWSERMTWVSPIEAQRHGECVGDRQQVHRHGDDGQRAASKYFASHVLPQRNSCSTDHLEARRWLGWR
jgi:hypothetical protein